MSNHESHVQFLGYEVLKFQFEQNVAGGKGGWSFYPEVRITSLGNNVLRGEVFLSANTFCTVEQGKPCSVSVLLRGLFEGRDMTQEMFEQYCLVKGSAYLVSPLRTLVTEFLARARSLPDGVLEPVSGP